MNIEQSFLKERPADSSEIQDLESGHPDIISAVEREDLFQINSIDPGAEEESIKTRSGHEVRGVNPDVWTLRMN